VSESKPAKEKADPTTKCILVLDDDETIRHMIQATLEVEGFRVYTGRDGRGVVQTALKYKPNLIITDLMMPNGGGFELIRSLQGDPDTASIPVILISGHGMDESTRTMLKQESNVVGFEPKPIRPAQFMSKVHQLLNTLSREEKLMRDRNKTNSDINDINKDRFEGLF
jgi:CheY-like chemotaxis protein